MRVPPKRDVYPLSPLQLRSPYALSSTAYIVIVIPALAGELIDSVWQGSKAPSGMLGAGGVSESGTADADDPASITTSTTRPIKGISLFMVASLSDADSWPQCMGKPPIGVALLAKPASQV